MRTSTLLIPIVSVATDDLTDAELIALNDAVQTGRDPHWIDGYPQISDLFTENGGTQMHRDTRVALAGSTRCLSDSRSLDSGCPILAGQSNFRRNHYHPGPISSSSWTTTT